MSRMHQYDFLSPANGFQSTGTAGANGYRYVPGRSRDPMPGSMASSLGRPYTVTPNGATHMDPAVGAIGPNPRAGTVLDLLQNAGNAVNGDGSLGSASGAIQTDTARMQGAANRQYVRNDQATQRFGDYLGGTEGAIMGEADRAGGLLTDFDKKAGTYGDSAVSSAEKFGDAATAASRTAAEGANRDLDKAGGYLDQSLQFSKDAVNTAKDAVAGYNAAFQEHTRAMVAGLDRRATTELNRINSGRHPDGSPMSNAERLAQQKDLNFNTGMQVATVVSNMWEESQKTAAGLRMQLANTQTAAAANAAGLGHERGVLATERLAAGDQVARTSMEAGAQRLQAEQVRQGYTQIRGSMLNLMTSIRTSSRALATQLGIQGRISMADMIRQNPESVVSLFSGIAAMASLNSSRNLGA